MFHPFVPFHIKMIEGFRKMNRRWLVSQTYTLAIDHFGEDAKEPILLTDYDEIIAAKIHYNALTDKYRYVLDLENEKHRSKVIEMIGAGSKFKVYAAFVEDMKQVEKKLNDKYTNNIRNYVSKKTNWRIGADKTIYPRLEVIFGELFVILKYGNQTERIRLSDLEKY